jgi:putative addiction module component (TIGR02574 family)
VSDSDIAEILRLPVEERLRLIDAIWDSIAEDAACVPLTDAQRGELDRRLDELEREGSKGIPAEEVLARLAQRKE